MCYCDLSDSDLQTPDGVETIWDLIYRSMWYESPRGRTVSSLTAELWAAGTSLFCQFMTAFLMHSDFSQAVCALTFILEMAIMDLATSCEVDNATIISDCPIWHCDLLMLSSIGLFVSFHPQYFFPVKFNTKWTLIVSHCCLLWNILRHLPIMKWAC